MIDSHCHLAGSEYAGDLDAVVERARASGVTAALVILGPLVRALGEIGLDYHYDFAPRDVQQAVFAAQLRLARRRRLPVVIHTREAEDDTFRVLADELAGDTEVVFHCFTGDRAMARSAYWSHRPT